MRGGIQLEIIIKFLKTNRILCTSFLVVICIAIIAIVVYQVWYKKKKNLNRLDKQEVENLSMIQIGNIHNIGKRESQQDSFGVSDLSNTKLCKEKGIFAVVADGMGGLAGGAEVSAIVTSYMLNCFTKSSGEKDIPNQLLHMLSGTNSEVRKYLDNNGNQQSGSTVVAVSIKDNQLHFLAVGDSRIYLLRGGSLIQINREHTYGSELDEKAARGEISVDDARNDSQRAALTSYIGMEEITHIDRSLRPVPLMSGDRVLLMSDGVFGTLSEEEISSVALMNAYDAATRFESAVLEKDKKGQDNFTSVIIELG